MGKPMKIVVGSLAVGVAAVGLFLYSRNAAAKQEGLKTVDITRGAIVDKALAVGQIVPRPGDPGQVADLRHRRRVLRRGRRPRRDRPAAVLDQPRPDAARARRGRAPGRSSPRSATTKAQQDLERNRSRCWRRHPVARAFDARAEDFDQARIALEQAQDKLALTKEGRIVRAVDGVDSVIRAPAAGTVLERKVNPGDPVVPLTSYQAGTELMTIADMGDLDVQGHGRRDRRRQAHGGHAGPHQGRRAARRRR